MKKRQKQLIFRFNTLLTQAEINDFAQQFNNLALEHGYSIIEFIAAIPGGEITLLIMGEDERDEAIKLLEKGRNRTLEYIARELKKSREIEERELKKLRELEE